MSDVPVAQALAIEIRAQHLLARQAADTAIDHARRAGMLLLQAKAALDHGEWLPWLAEHCALSIVGADPNLSHRADRILSQGWGPAFRGPAVDKCRSVLAL